LEPVLYPRRRVLGASPPSEAVHGATAPDGFDPRGFASAVALLGLFSQKVVTPILNANTKDLHAGFDLFGVCDFCAEQSIDAVDLT
jgi:hypothetical protein